MMYYCDRSDSDRLIKLEIENMEMALSLFDLAADVVRSFNGKVLNKRLDSALREANKDLRYTRDSSDYLNIEYSCFDNRSIQTNSCTVYIRTDDIKLSRLAIEKAVNDDNRIVAENIIADMENKKNNIIERINEYKTGLLKVDEWKNRCEKIGNEMDELSKEIPSVFKDYYNLSIYPFGSF